MSPVRDLKKTYHTKNGTTADAVKGISFDVKRGEIFGFLGANGAGKSTTISLTTHYMEEPERFCENIAIVNDEHLDNM